MQQDADRRLLTDWAGLMHALGPNFAERADCCDANDTFVAENFAASNNGVCLPRVRRPSLVAAVHPILSFRDAASSCPVLWLDSTHAVHAHAPSCDHRLALVP
jgi:hypothetical protein